MARMSALQGELGGYRRMTRKARVGGRLRYWFDNTMSRGTLGLIGWLALTSLALVVAVTVGLAIVDPKEGAHPFLLLWQTFIATFGLGGPATETSALAVYALWFVLGVGGIFIVSALIGLLTSGLNRRLEQLRKGRSVVAERGHTVILGWSDQVYTLISELIE